MHDRLNSCVICYRCKDPFYPAAGGVRLRAKENKKEAEYYILCERCRKEFKKFLKMEVK